MDFTEPASVQAFRCELRTWLETHLDDRFRGLGYEPEAGEQWLSRMREWNALLADAGYAAIAWPVEYGGRGAGLIEQVVWAEEMHRAGAPPTLNPIGIANIAPSILEWGTEDQKRTLLPRMLRGDDIWCQGFSEPEAGSDLASLTTTARRDGDVYVVNGQKVWTTFGHVANWCELLVRTDPDAPRHRGISCLLVDMTTPGIEVRPLVTITGEREFNEILFIDVRVPVGNLLGPENEGWRVAMTTLAHERAGVANLHLGVRAKIGRLIGTARDLQVDGRPLTSDPGVRRRLARAYLEGEYLKLLAERAVSGALHGRAAGPESSVAKLVWSELEQDLGLIAAELLGPDANAGEWGRDRVYTRALTIAGGTTQVNKNVIAQRILGLPRS
ncbi:acyl-CoA dehydrogenase family protein [Rhabdothermincola sediminis]|uniref:acyl-CoA dehydrogenase family protein n=1 Tax=Rhabdothermincola sediminis TaxID=2751370 RepID=UPI001AA0A4D4|nr:acyl-CoA dehydrogenase family protein [Rhabdothermincola sediminis]